VFDENGDLLVADSANHRVVRIDLDQGSIETVAGGYQQAGCRDGRDARFDLPEGLALDDQGHLYVSEYGNHTVRRIDLASGAVSTVAGRCGRAGHADGIGTRARFDAPSSLVHHDGQLYVAESHGLVLRRIDLASSRVSTVAGQYQRPGSADGVGDEARFDHHQSSALGEVPYGMTIAGGAIYLADSGNHTLRRINPVTGEVTTVAGSSIAGATPPPRAHTLSVGTLFVTAGQGLYRREGADFQLVAGHPEEIGQRDGTAGRARFRGPFALASLEAGELVVGEVNGQVRLVDPQSGRVRTLFDFDRLLFSMTVDDQDRIYVGRLFEISRLSKDGEATVIASRSPGEAAVTIPSLQHVVAIAADGDLLYFLDERRFYSPFDPDLTTLRRVDLQSGATRALASWTSDHQASPPGRRTRGLAPAADGTLIIAHASGALTRFDPGTATESVIIAEEPDTRGVALGPKPHVNRPVLPLFAPDGSLHFIDEGAVLRLSARD
jgi:streptogramin lyase